MQSHTQTIKTVGIIGGGQLAQLLAWTAYALNLKTLCLVSEENAPAARFSPVLIGDLHDEKIIARFCDAVDVVTIENENIAVDVLEKISKYKSLFPNINAIAISQDRLLEKNFFKSLDISTTDYVEVRAAPELKNKNGFLKTRRLGYDGRGQLRIHANTDLSCAEDLIKQQAIFENIVLFDCEVSQLIARNQRGEIVFFPLIENVHREGILRTSCFSKQIALQDSAQHYAKKIAEALDYVGVLAIEFFVRDGKLIANEMAPRVHNSGHLTIEGCCVSQFESHLRAITGAALLAPRIVARNVEMHNIVSVWPEDLTVFEHVYDYGKAPRPNRKLGHVIKWSD